jgi:predicted nucleotide-binding protein (sugar kinase/HSP70/actin superfamily)
MFSQVHWLPNSRRAHFKQQQHERADMISMTRMEKEKSVQKAAKAVEALHRKMEKKTERVERLRGELAANWTEMNQILANNPDSGSQNSQPFIGLRGWGNF